MVECREENECADERTDGEVEEPVRLRQSTPRWVLHERACYREREAGREREDHGRLSRVQWGERAVAVPQARAELARIVATYSPAEPPPKASSIG